MPADGRLASRAYDCTLEDQPQQRDDRQSQREPECRQQQRHERAEALPWCHVSTASPNVEASRRPAREPGRAL